METELVNQSDGKDKHLVGDDMFLLSNKTYMKPKGGFHHSLLHDYEDNSFSRAKNEFSIDRVHDEGKVYSDDRGIFIDYPDEFFTKRRRLDDDGKLVMDKVTEDGLYNSRSPLQFPYINTQKDSSNEEGRLGDNCRGLTVDWVGGENQVDKNLNPVLYAEYLLHPYDIRMTDGGILMHRNRMRREFNKDISFGKAFETESFGKPLNRSRLSIDDDKFLNDDCPVTEYSAGNPVKQSDRDLLVQARKVTNDHQCSTNVNFENRYHVHHDGSLSASENLCNLLHKVRKTIAGGNLPINERIESAPNFGACSVAGSENFASPMQYDLRTIHNGEISIVDRKATESTLSLAALKNSRYIANRGGRVVDDDRFRKRNGVENLEDIDEYVSPAIYSEHHSLIRVPQSHDPSCSIFDHNTKAYPYVSKISIVDQGCSSEHSISSVPDTGCENVGVIKRCPFPNKSNEHHYALGGNFSIESQRMSGYVPYKTMNMLARKNILFPDENDFGVHGYQAESDLKSAVGRFLKMSNNMNLKKHREHSEAPRLISNNRKSVFTRLTSGEDIQLDEERNEDHFNCQDCYMDSSADEVMEMLNKGKNVPCSRVKNIRIVGQHNRRETSLDGKQMKGRVNVNQLILEKKISKDAYLGTVKGSDKVPEETRIVDFKRRSETKKNLVGTGTTSVAIKNIIDDNGEAENSAKKIFKRKRLVRPVFRENKLLVENLVREKNARFPQILDKDDEHFETAICTGEAQIPNDNSRSNNVLSLGSQQSRDNSMKENTNQGENKCIV